MDEQIEFVVFDYFKYLNKSNPSKNKKDKLCYYHDEDKKLAVLRNKIKITQIYDKIIFRHVICFCDNNIIYFRKSLTKNWSSHFLFPSLIDYKNLYKIIKPNYKLRPLKKLEIELIERVTGLETDYCPENDKTLLMSILGKSIEDLVIYFQPRPPCKTMTRLERKFQRSSPRGEAERDCYDAREFLNSKSLDYYLDFTDIVKDNFVKVGEKNIIEFERNYFNNIKFIYVKTLFNYYYMILKYSL
jgi:hypothetical protein